MSGGGCFDLEEGEDEDLLGRERERERDACSPVLGLDRRVLTGGAEGT